jgi:hypothetical protein
MKKFTSIFLYSCTAMVIVLSIGLSSCGSDDDKEPEAKAQLPFTVTEKTVNEADGTVEFEVSLDKPAAEDFTIEYEWSGTAYEKTTPHPTTGAYDYEILGGSAGELEIPEGETTGTIEIKFYSDRALEDPETINLSIEDIDTELVEISRDDELDITLEQEDGLIVVLQWSETYTDVDMDLFLWIQNAEDEFELTNVSSQQPDFTSPEAFFVPTAIMSDGVYGISANYFEGTENPMEFLLSYVEFKDGAEQTPVEREGSYTLANINPWFVNETTPPQNLQVEFTFEKSGSTFSNFSEITVPAEYSRIRTSGKPGEPRKRQMAE